MTHRLKKISICVGIVAIVLSGCGSNEEAPAKKETGQEEKVSLVTNNLYVEPVNPTIEQIKVFNKLSKAVKEENYEEEAKMAAVNFAFDFFSLSNKTSSEEEVGGLQFIPTTKIFRFKEFAKPYYYNNYGTIVNEYGKDSLPEVKAYKIESVKADEYTLNGNPCEGYDITLTLTYADTDIPKEKLKTTMVISVISISDFPYDRTVEYKVNNDFVGERINVYRVLSVK